MLTSDIPLRKLSGLDRAQAYATDLARSAARLAIRRTVRTADVVASEYDGGHWTRVLQARQWEQSPDLAAFLVGTEAREAICKINNEIVSARVCDYYRYRLVALSRLLRDLAGDVHRIVELGSGFGYNLFSLATTDTFAQLQGFDVSRTGIDAGAQIAQHFGLSGRVSFDHLDLTNERDPNFFRIEGETCFTHFVIEQIPYSVAQVLQNIIAHRPRRVIHIEPSHGHVALHRPRSWVNYLYVKSMDYQSQLFTSIDALERAGTIRVTRRERMNFASTFHNDGHIVVWEPV